MAIASRRDFLKLTATAAVGGGLIFALKLRTNAIMSDERVSGAPFAPNAFLRIDRTGNVTFIVPYVEMGQGTYTSIPMLIAEELEVDIGNVVIEHAPPNEELYINPLFGLQATGGSTAIRASWEPMRHAGATARTMLVAAAANVWKVAPDTCHAENGSVVHVASGRRLGYGALADAAAKLPVPSKVALKEPADFKLIGTSHKRLDTPDKLDGSAKFGIDARLPGMTYAVVAIAPTFGGKLASADEAKAKAVSGVTRVIRMEDAVAVIGIHTFAAKQGLMAANPTWAAGPNARLSTADIAAQLAAAASKPGVVVRQDGDAVATIAKAPSTFEAVYEQPFLAHAAMEPMNCTVHVTRTGCEVWVGTQVAARTQEIVAKVTGLAASRVRVHNHLLGGGFGRRLEIDGIERAARIATQVDGPVQVIWTREEDIQHDMYRPYYYDRLTAGLDARGKPVGWLHRFAGSSILARFAPVAVQNGVDPDAIDGVAPPPYAVADMHVEWVAHEPPGIPTAFWRGVGSTRGTFVIESFIDELAQKANEDPLTFRLALLQKNPRAAAVLQLAADRSGWAKAPPPGRGRGIALCTGFGSFIAQVVEVAVAQGEVKVTRVVCATDCGMIVNPDTVRAQMEGGIVFGLSAALYGEITLKDGRVEQSNFHDYRVLRINESPVIEVYLVGSSEAPGGIGEPGCSCVMPALTNAVFAATGKRVRKLPVANQLASA